MSVTIINPKTIPNKRGSIIIIFSIHNHLKNTKAIIKIYLNPTAACQTKAKSKKSTGITGRMSTIGLKIAKASGNLASKTSVME
jgi:hypothetical protein